METKILQVNPEQFGDEELQEACQVLRNDGLVAFPTETVYGLGGNALHKEAANHIYAAKGRPSDNPLIVHISEVKSLYELAADVPEAAKKLSEAFWPGPLTMILPKADIVPKSTTGGLDTVAIRMPSHPIAKELIRQSGVYIAAPSANLSGRPSPTKAEHVIEDLSGRIDMIIDGGEVGIGLESTIVDLTGDVPMVLRPGYITLEMLREVLGNVEVDPAVLSREVKPGIVAKAPGMKYRHYAPKGQLTIVEGETKQVVASILQMVHDKQKEGYKVAVIAAQETANCYPSGIVYSIGSRKCEGSIAKELIRQSGVYIAAPSANLSGRPSPTKAEHVIEDLSGRIDMIIDGGEVGIGLESTIVDLTGDVPMVLRPGYITLEMLREVLGNVEVDPAVLSREVKPGIVAKAPGMKYRHYAPKGQLTIVEGETKQVVASILQMVHDKQKEGYKVAVIAAQETANCYPSGIVYSIGSRKCEGSIAAGLYDILREMDHLGAEYIFAESFEDDNLGQAIMNRMLKAAGYHIVKA